MIKLYLEHSIRSKRSLYTWGRSKLKPPGQATPRESTYMEGRIPGTYKSALLAHSRCHASIIVFFSGEPQSEPHLKTVLWAARINYSPLAWLLWRFRGHV